MPPGRCAVVAFSGVELELWRKSRGALMVDGEDLSVGPVARVRLRRSTLQFYQEARRLEGLRGDATLGQTARSEHREAMR
jgi:hypothetical protein